MRLNDFKRAHPNVHIAGDSGKWLVLVCLNRAWRFSSYHDALAASRESCCVSRGCFGPATHGIIEVTEEAARPATSGSFRRMVEQA